MSNQYHMRRRERALRGAQETTAKAIKKIRELTINK